MALQNTDVLGGTMSPKTFNPPSECIGNAAIRSTPTNPVSAEKLEHQHALVYRQKTGADIVDATEDLYTVHGVTGELVSVDVVATTGPTGSGDKKFTVDVQKGSAGVAFATMLTAPAEYPNGQASRSVVEGALVGSPTLADGDTLRVIVDASGSTGSQGQGLVVTISVRELPNP